MFVACGYNIGLIGTFHLIGADASLVNQFVDEFLAYGEVELAEDFYLSGYIDDAVALASDRVVKIASSANA